MQNFDIQKYKNYLEQLKDSFDRRFEDFGQFKTAFKFSVSPTDITSSEMEGIARQFNVDELKCSNQLNAVKSAVDVMGVEPFNEIKNKPDLKKVYCKILSMFADSYNCESAFSNLAFILNKYRNSLTQQHLKYALKISATNFNLNYEKLLKNCQKSH